jgi:hypothetical protein
MYINKRLALSAHSLPHALASVRRHHPPLSASSRHETDSYSQRFECIFGYDASSRLRLDDPYFFWTRGPRPKFFVAQATNPDENEDENDP